ncbi:MAG: hypothetical protein PUK72_07570 [Oscillospiraceae bacterium]|nr:hypothetical protein [Oscillospiraceae bacterium]
METQKEGAVAMKYDFDYEGVKEIFDHRFSDEKNLSGKRVQHGWLPEFNKSTLEEGERLNILLPLMQWQTEHDDVTEEIKGEMEWYYDAFEYDNFEKEIDEEERELVKKIFFECYNKAFKK